MRRGENLTDSSRGQGEVGRGGKPAVEGPRKKMYYDEMSDFPAKPVHGLIDRTVMIVMGNEYDV